MDQDRPLYLQIADQLRQKINTGELPPGTRLPSRPEIMRDYGVSDVVAKEVARVLISEGLAIARPGSGTYVRSRPQLQRLVRAWYRGLRKGSPFAAEMQSQGRQSTWEHNSRTVQAPPEVRDRLGLPEPSGDDVDVLRTDYVFSADGEPVMLSTSYEPLDLTRGTPIVMPEEGPHAGRGVQERMLAIGVIIDGWVETVGGRLGTAEECGRLQHAPGSVVLTISRAYHAGERVVEIAEIVFPADRFQFVYSGPVGE